VTRGGARRAIGLLEGHRHPGRGERIDHFPHQFSGGMRQRVVIALALAAEPKLIVADEPTTALDVSIQAQIIQLLKRICRERGAAVMLITHDMGVIAETCDRVAVMYAGRIAEIGPVHEVINQPAHPYTRADGLDSRHHGRPRTPEPDRRRHAAPERHPARLRLQPALPARLRPLHARAARPAACRRHRAACWLHDAETRHEEPWRRRTRHPLEPLGRGARDRTSVGKRRHPLVQAHDLAKTFDVSAPWLNRVLERKPRQLLHAVDGVSFDIEKGQTLALVGESGCGKSTVARLLVGLYQPTRGGFTFDGQDAHAAFKTPRRPKLRRRIQMIFQDPYASLNPRWKVEDIVGEPLKEHGLVTDAAQLKARVGELLQSVGLSPLDMVKYPHQFSGGQRQRISIARALATQPEFLVCDEPTSALDVSVQAQVLNIMKDLQRKQGLTYLFISHNLAVVRHVSDQVGVMYLGRLVELAGKHQLFGQPRHPYTRMLLDAIPKMHDTGRARTPVQGEVPNPLNPPTGCAFNPRCPHANERCRVERPALLEIGASRVAAMRWKRGGSSRQQRLF
jgi:peptide/nickel transport system ATP-binding protein